MSSPKGPPSPFSEGAGGPSCLLSLQGALQDQQVGVIQSPLKLPPLDWVSEHVRFCMCPLRVESLLPITPQLSQT